MTPPRSHVHRNQAEHMGGDMSRHRRSRQLHLLFIQMQISSKPCSSDYRRKEDDVSDVWTS